MHVCDETFKQVEDHEMTVDHLIFTKIGKVMRHIGDMGEIPRQEEFRFQERARHLVKQWSRLLTPGHDDYAKCCDHPGSEYIGADLPIIHDILRVRGRCIGTGGGLKEVIVLNASGGATSVTLPYS